MLFRFFIFLVGFGLAVAGGISIIAYLNIMTTGHGFAEYIFFMSQRIETYLFFTGVFIIWLSIYFPLQK
ncbi:hypothetical protein JOD45_000205 [Scopulibacillus daqui]|uniref:Uncharacterized protein n=1 Tax=Scopulibacillus daqui TaxID=1469162 RepID=A0ABS2PX15_9BACL|nr:hypothetical protein [Scopulibacillus daqui]MBM7644014.1 hypothetical protein [Scopulibacillus daqui]